MLSNDVILCSIIGIVGTFIIYFVDIKNVWQKLRIEYGLAEKADKNSPCVFDKCKYIGKRIFIKNCCWLFFISFLISLGLSVLHLTLNADKSLGSISEYALYGFKQIFAYFSFMNILALGDCPVDSADSTNNLKKFADVISKVRLGSVEKCVSKELLLKKCHMENSIEQWYNLYEQNKDKSNPQHRDNPIPMLVLRIKENYIMKKLPEETSQATKDEFNDFKLLIVEKYVTRAGTFYDELQEFFCYPKEIYSLKVMHLLEFMRTVEIVRASKTLGEINQEIGKIPKKTKVKVSEISIDNTDFNNTQKAVM